MATTKQIIRDWANSRSSGGPSALMTDGDKLWSYGLIIGATIGDTKVVANYRSVGGEYVSKTTSRHVGYAVDVADKVLHPEYFRKSGFDK